MGYMSIIMILSILISTLMSLIVLTNYKLSNKISISIIIEMLVINIVGPIICIISIFLMDFIPNALNIQKIGTMAGLDKLYALAYAICMYISPFYAFCINRKKSKKYFFLVTILFIIIITMVLIYIEITGDKFDMLNKMKIYEE